jgi:hypothetical protein
MTQLYCFISFRSLICRLVLFFTLAWVLAPGCTTSPSRIPGQLWEDLTQTAPEKVAVRNWKAPASVTFPLVAEAARRAFPRSKIHQDPARHRLHFWHMGSEQGEALVMMQVKEKGSGSTLYIYEPRYGVDQPLYVRDPILFTGMLKDLDARVRKMRIPTSIQKGAVP